MSSTDTPDSSSTAGDDLVCHIWVVHPPDNRFCSTLVFGESDELTEHAPEFAMAPETEVEYLGTFDEVEERVEEDGFSTSQLQDPIVAPDELTEAVGRDRFWDVIESLQS